MGKIFLHRSRGCTQRNVAVLGTSVTLLVGLAGCSLDYVDRDGNQHVIGLVDMAVKATDESQTWAGSVVDLTTLGVAVSNRERGSNVMLGYSRSVTAALRDNVLVLGDPLSVSAASVRGAKNQYGGAN